MHQLRASSVCLLKSLTLVPCPLLVLGTLTSHLGDCKSFFISPLPHSLLPSCSLFFQETHSPAASLSRLPGSRRPRGLPSLSVLLPPGHLSALPRGPSHPSPPAPCSQIELCPFFSCQLQLHPPRDAPRITRPDCTPWLSSWKCLEMTHLLESLLY